MGFKNGKYEMGYKDTFYYYERFISDKYGSEDKKDKRWSIIRAIVISLVILVIWLVYYSKNGESPTLVLAFYNTIEWWGFTKRSAHRYIKRCKEINNEKEQSYIYRFEIPQIIPVKYYQYFTVAQEMKLVLLPINIGSELLEEFAQQPYTSIRSMVVCRRNKEIFDVIEEYTSEPRLFIRDSEEDYRAFCSSTFQEANNIVSKYLAEYNYYVSFIDVDFDNKLINYMTNNIKPDASNIRRHENNRELVTILFPDVGDFQNLDVIKVFVSIGDIVAAEDSLITLESDKATMDIPSPIDGAVEEIHVNVGNKISQGLPICTVRIADNQSHKV